MKTKRSKHFPRHPKCSCEDPANPSTVLNALQHYFTRWYSKTIKTNYGYFVKKGDGYGVVHRPGTEKVFDEKKFMQIKLCDLVRRMKAFFRKYPECAAAIPALKAMMFGKQSHDFLSRSDSESVVVTSIDPKGA